MAAPTPASLPLRSTLSVVPWLHAVPGAIERWIPRGRVVAPQGRETGFVHVVEEGALILISTDPVGSRAALGVLGRGAIFGQESLGGWIGGRSLPTDALPPEARTIVPSRVVSIPADEVRLASERQAWIAAWLMASLALRARWLERCLVRTLLLSVTDRVHATLEDLASEFGRHGPEGVQIEVPVTQETLAQMVGATRESVNRAVHALAERGLLRRSQGSYLLLSHPPPRPPGGHASTSTKRSPAAPETLRTLPSRSSFSR